MGTAEDAIEVHCTKLLDIPVRQGRATKLNRWIRLSAAVVAMIPIGNLQYAWTLFVRPISTATGWKLSEVQWGFTFFVALMMGIGGLMATAQVGVVAGSFGVGATALTIALTLNPLANGGGRIFWGWVSDQMGRERTMFLAFSLQALFLVSVVTVGRLSQEIHRSLKKYPWLIS
jgi:hypothetical protein